MRRVESGDRLRAGILGSMFCAGLYSILAQVAALRELLVVFFGNEVTLGAIMAFWLISLSLGSLIIYRFLDALTSARLRAFMIISLSALAFLLPLQIIVIRQIRAILDVPFGEYISFGNMMLGTGIVLAPPCLMIGAVFPSACRLAAEQYRHAVNRVYAYDALGSMTGGALFTFLLVRFMSPLAVAAFAGACALAGAALLSARRTLRVCLAAGAICMALAGFCPECTNRMEQAGIRSRWRSLGVIPDRENAGTARLLYSTDSRYQNLALIEAEGQKTLYGNGQLMFVFPDTIAGEHRIHFIMAQNPDAQSVLLIGGAPADDISELLKYPLRRLLYVELDEKIHGILEKYGGESYRQALEDPRLEKRFLDGPRFVKTCREKFDVIIVLAPSPTTIALNRYYTIEFFRDIARILAPDGFLYTSVESSLHLQTESAGLSASIYKSLSEVFERVLVTAGEENRFFAGSETSALTLDRETLFRRSAGAALQNDYFRPEYFLDADEISPEKVDFVEHRLKAADVPPNTAIQPVSTFYSLMLWSRLSDSRMNDFFAELHRTRARQIYFIWPAACAVFLIAGFLPGLLKKFSPATAVSGMNRFWARFMMNLAISSTGCCEMALQIILVFVFQNIFGYVYARIGLIVAVFMMGLTLGAFSAIRMISPRQKWACMFGLEILIICAALAIPLLTRTFTGTDVLVENPVLIEILIYGIVAITGLAGGAQFSLANHILRGTGGRIGAIAATANAADLLGSAVGGFAIGVMLMPLLGINAACMILAVVKAGSVLCVFSAMNLISKPELSRSP